MMTMTVLRYGRWLSVGRNWVVTPTPMAMVARMTATVPVLVWAWPLTRTMTTTDVADTVDGYPLVSIGSLTDTDGDGRPNDCDSACVALGHGGGPG